MLRKIPIVSALLFGLLGTAQAGLIINNPGEAFDGVDVGSKDIFTASTGVLSGIAAEEAWAESVLGMDLTFKDSSGEYKTEDVDWYWTNTAEVIAFQLTQGSGYYLVKNSTTTVLFENVASLEWGVIDRLADLGLGADDMQISHVTEDKFGPGTGGAPGVPVPAPLALIGLGGLMLGWQVKRKSRA